MDPDAIQEITRRAGVESCSARRLTLGPLRQHEAPVPRRRRARGLELRAGRPPLRARRSVSHRRRESRGIHETGSIRTSAARSGCHRRGAARISASGPPSPCGLEQFVLVRSSTDINEHGVSNGDRDHEQIERSQEVRSQGSRKGGASHARKEARSAALRSFRQESHEPQAGHRHRALGSAASRREGAAQGFVEALEKAPRARLGSTAS